MSGEVRWAPRATYRVQLHAGFGFAAAADLADYLAEPGISTVAPGVKGLADFGRGENGPEPDNE
jgi:hypothetical protein